MTRKEQKEARRIQILKATLDLFVKRGYYGTKTSQISRQAGISEGLLFHYFPTKEILLEELVNIGLEGMRMPMEIKAEHGLDFINLRKRCFCRWRRILLLQKCLCLWGIFPGLRTYRRNSVSWLFPWTPFLTAKNG